MPNGLVDSFSIVYLEWEKHRFSFEMARVQLAYPKIPDSRNLLAGKCIAFEKYDGTNLHWVWDAEMGWYAFGTRRDRFDLDAQGIADFNAAHPGLEEAAEIFQQEFADRLEPIFRSHPDYNCPEIVVFTEFFGANSFAGMHKPQEPKELVLFDAQIDRGMVAPDRFVQDFSSVKIAKVIYRGKLTGKFIDDLRAGKYGVAEGVVCKGVDKNNSVRMLKIKTNEYMKKLQQAFQDDWEQYWE
jgi:RNA ligase